jgi:hypothetical protein
MSEELQFEKAEYADAAAVTACAACQGDLRDNYFTVGDRILCRGCAEKLREELDNQGTRAGRLLRATAAGLGAAALGSLLYYGVAAMTGYEFGLIAIVVGFGVGTAVRWGSKGRGGWAYQTLAIALTYLSIVSTYIPPIIQGLRESKVEAAASATTNETPGQGAASVTPVSQDTSQNAPQTASEATPATAGQVVFAVVLLLLIACVAPFLAGFQNIMGLIIIGIGLYEAWKLNKRVPIEISGPHVVGASRAA